MVAEMLLVCFAPSGQPGLLLRHASAQSRICSGIAEASASGADEALAYDSLPSWQGEGQTRGPVVLASLMRWQSGGFFVVMILGIATVHDPAFVHRQQCFSAVTGNRRRAASWCAVAGLFHAGASQ